MWVEGGNLGAPRGAILSQSVEILNGILRWLTRIQHQVAPPIAHRPAADKHKHMVSVRILTLFCTLSVARSTDNQVSVPGLRSPARLFLLRYDITILSLKRALQLLLRSPPSTFFLVVPKLGGHSRQLWPRHFPALRKTFTISGFLSCGGFVAFALS